GHARYGVEEGGVAAALELRLAPLPDHLVVDSLDDLRPELGLGDMGVDVDQEIILVALRLFGRVREHVAGIGPGGDLFELAIIAHHTLEHGPSPGLRSVAALQWF